MTNFLAGIVCWYSGVVGALAVKSVHPGNLQEPAFWAMTALFCACIGLCLLNKNAKVTSGGESELKYAAEQALQWMQGAIKMHDNGPLGVWVDPVTIDQLRLAISHSSASPVMPKPPKGFVFTKSYEPPTIEVLKG